MKKKVLEPRTDLKPKNQKGAGAQPRRVISLMGMAAALALCGPGCSVLSYSGANGERFSRMSLGVKTAIAGLKLEAGTNGLQRLELQGFQTDANQALGVVTEAAVRAAIGH